MTNSRIASAVGAALALAGLYAAPAFANKPSAYSSDDNILFLSGATAVDTALESFARLKDSGGNAAGLCAAGTIHIYRGNNQKAVLCNGRSGTVNGVAIGLVKESAGGSERGIDPVAAVGTLPFLDVRSGSFVCGGVDNNTATNDAGTFNPAASIDVPRAMGVTSTTLATDEYLNCTGTSNKTARAGIADVEPKLFGNTGNNLAVTALGQVVFGVPVSLNLYRALQKREGLLTGAPCNTTPDDVACVPSLSSAQIAGLYSGIISDWATFDPTLVSGATTPPTSRGGNPASQVYVCRRGTSSGTQTFAQAYFLHQGCGGSDSFVAPTGGDATNGTAYTAGNTATVWANSSSGNVRTCLDDKDTQNVWAIGVMSTDTSATLKWRFVKVNGARPSFEEVANSSYDFYSENVCVAHAPSTGLTANQATVRNQLCGDSANGVAVGLANPTVIAGINAGTANQPWGDGGLLTKPDFVTYVPNTSPVTRTAMASNPVNSTTKSAGGAINNCGVALVVTDTPSGGH